MRRQPLHESLGGSVMTKRPRGRAQITQDIRPLGDKRFACSPYKLIEAATPSPSLSSSPSPSPSSSPLGISDKNQLISRTLRNNTSAARAGFLVIRQGLARHTSFKTSIFGRPFEVANVVTQVGKLPGWNLVLIFLVLTLLTQPIMCKPWVEETPDTITFRSRICQQVSPSELRKRMGAAFDGKKMAVDKASAQRLAEDDAMSSLSKGSDGYQSDGPAATDNISPGMEQDGFHLVENERYRTSGEMFVREEGMVYSNSGQLEGKEEVDVDFDLKNGREEIDIDVDLVEDGDEFVGGKSAFGTKRSWPERRRILSSHKRDTDGVFSGSNEYEKYETLDNEESRSYGDSDSYKYMRRRRRRRRSLKVDDDDSEQSSGRRKEESLPRKSRKNDKRKSNRKEASYNGKQSSKKDSNVPLRLILSGNVRKSRRLRKKLRKKLRKEKFNKPPPWQCKLITKIKVLDKDIFPRILMEGKCATDKCFYRLYNCEPKKYAIKLLQRDRSFCNPLPVVGNSTVYEEKWNIITKHIIVGCNCVNLIDSENNKNRRKN